MAALIPHYLSMTSVEIFAAFTPFFLEYVFYLALGTVFDLRMTLGLIQYARMAEFLYAFVLNEMYEAVERIGGWIAYALAWLGEAVQLTLITIVLLKIPVAGWIALLVLAPFLIVVSAKFMTDLLPVQEMEDTSV